jgi:hypothetical protein
MAKPDPREALLNRLAQLGLMQREDRDNALLADGLVRDIVGRLDEVAADSDRVLAQIVANLDPHIAAGFRHQFRAEMKEFQQRLQNLTTEVVHALTDHITERVAQISELETQVFEGATETANTAPTDRGDGGEEKSDAAGGPGPETGGDGAPGTEDSGSADADGSSS